jgi:quercetin dioxygenase-like cupin family protein
MHKSKTIALLLLLWCAPGLAFKAQTAVANEEPELPHALDAGWKGQKTCELLFEDDTNRVVRCTFPPGIGHEKHYHNPHFGYVLAGGTMRITDKEGEHEVPTKTGGSWSTETVTVHEAMNIGETTTRYLIVEPIKR